MTINAIIDGLATCFETFLLLYLLQDQKQRGSKYRQILFFLVQVLMVVIMTRLDFPPWPKILYGIVSVTILGSTFVYNISIFRLLFYSIVYEVVLIFSNELAVGVWNIFNDPSIEDNLIYEDFIPQILFMYLAFFIVSIIISRKIINRNRQPGNMKELIPILCVSVPFLLVLECLFLLLPHLTSMNARIFYMICCAAILFAFIYILLFLERYTFLQKKMKEEEIISYESQLKADYYEQRKEDEEKIREVYHDLKNHLLLVNDEPSAKEILGKIESYESYMITGNEFLDIVISEKIKLAQKRGVRVECEIDFHSGSFMETLDISTIFGNLLDNAIEAAEKVTESEKYVHISVKRRAQMIIIVIKNTMVGTFEESIKTSKVNKTFHGYGLRNVRAALKKYEGYLDIVQDGTEFSASVIVPIYKTDNE